MSEAVLSAFVTNLGKYNEGYLVGEWLKLPTDTETVQALYSRIGMDGVRYEEFFITDYESAIPGLHRYLGEYESLDELNYLAAMVEELDDVATEGGEFVGGGYIEGSSDNFVEHYDGREDIPEEYRVCAFPKERSILETLKAFRENPPLEAGGKLAPALAYAER